MDIKDASPKAADTLFKSTMMISTVSLFVAIAFLFSDVRLSIYIANFTLVGVIGVISYLRHSVFFRSDQARMGWYQDHPEFQIEVGFANLAVGFAAIVAVALDLGLLANGMTLLMYGTYLACAGAMHTRQFMRMEKEKRNPGKIFNFALFSTILLVFALLAMFEAGVF